MPLFYERKRPGHKVNEENMRKAIREYRESSQKSFRKVAVKYGVKKSTLQARVIKIETASKNEAGGVDDSLHSSSGLKLGYRRNKYSVNQIFSDEEETILAEYAVEAVRLNFGVTIAEFRKLTYRFAVSLKKSISKKWIEDGKASEAWYKSFMHRHPRLSLRTPENTSVARIRALNKENLNMFFNNYVDVIAKHGFVANDIYNFDETSLPTVLSSPKVIAPKGQKQIGQATSAERGCMITFGAFINALGNTLPPVYVFPGYAKSRRGANAIHIGPNGVEGAPENSLGLFTKSSWMMNDAFVDVLQHFQKYTRASITKPVLLLMDNHASHCSYEAVKYAKENGISLLTFPPHLTNKLQPLDVSLYSPFKSAMKIATKDRMDSTRKPIQIG